MNAGTDAGRVTGTTQTGFEFSVPEKVIKDWRFVNLIAAVENKDELRVIGAITEVVPVVFGEKKDELFAHCTDEDGIIDSERVTAEFKDIINAIKEHKAKNSSSSPA